MAIDFHKFIAEVTRLTRAGDPQSATSLIQQALNQHTFAADASHDQGVIDVEAREVFPGEDRLPPPPLFRHEGGPLPAVKPPDPTGRFIKGRFAQGSAGRDFKLFIPPSHLGDSRRPLLVMLHGCTQDPDDFAAGTRMNQIAAEQGLYVLYPAQSRKANPQGCWNWFKASHQQRGRGECATLADMTRQVMAEYPIDPSRVYVAGLSAGGAMAAVLAQAYPDLYAALGVHSGLPPGAAKDLPSALAAMKGARGHVEPLRVPTIIFHGDADCTVDAQNGTQLFAASGAEVGASESETFRPDGSLHAVTRHRRIASDGRVLAEYWVVHGAGHAWFGGDASGSYTEPGAPDATTEMLAFFLSHRLSES